MSTKSQFPILNDADWLRERYITDRLTAKQIAEEVGCHRESVTRALLRFGIRPERRGPTRYKQLADAEWLAAEIAVKPLRQIADEIGCSYSGVVAAARKFDIEVPDRPHRRLSATRSDNIKKTLRERYPEGRIGAAAGNWRGGKPAKVPSGYVTVYAPGHPKARGNRVFEHVIVAEAKLGRFLLPDECVHHINEIRDDNRPENLEVLTRAEHVKTHFGNGTDLRKRVERLEMLLERICEKLDIKMEEQWVQPPQT